MISSFKYKTLEKIGHPLCKKFLDPPRQTKLENERKNISQMKKKWLIVK